MDFVDDSEIETEDDDKKVEKKRTNNPNITLPDILNVLFDGKAPQILKILIALNNQIRAYDKRLKSLDAHVFKLIAKYCSVRWNIKLNILKAFVKKFTGFMRFYQACSQENIVIRSVISSEKKLQGEILVKMLWPYGLLDQVRLWLLHTFQF